MASPPWQSVLNVSLHHRMMSWLENRWEGGNCVFLHLRSSVPIMCQVYRGSPSKKTEKSHFLFRTLMSRLVSCLQCARKSREGEGKTRPLNEQLLFWLEAPLIKRGIVIVPAGSVWTSNSKCVWEILLISFFPLSRILWSYGERKKRLLRTSDSSLSYISF